MSQGYRRCANANQRANRSYGLNDARHENATENGWYGTTDGSNTEIDRPPVLPSLVAERMEYWKFLNVLNPNRNH